MVNNSNQYNATNSSAAAMFIDAATIAGSAYAPFLTHCGKDARALFSRVYERACAFSQIPLILNSNTTAQFGSNNVNFDFPKNADYVNGLYLRFLITNSDPSANASLNFLRTVNFGHQLIQKCSMKFGGRDVVSLNNHILNLMQVYHVPNSQKRNYYNMINGNHARNPSMLPSGSAYYDSVSSLDCAQGNNNEFEVIVPLPFWFCQQSNNGAALPIAAIPYNELQLSLDIADLNKVFSGPDRNQVSFKISKVEAIANSIVVSNEERAAMACTPRDVLMRQYDHVQVPVSRTEAKNTVKHTLSPSKPVQAIYFGAHGSPSLQQDLSNVQIDLSDNAVMGDPSVYCDLSGTSLVRAASFNYDNKARVGRQSYQYYQNVQPLFHSVGSGYSGIRDEGKLMYSFALDVNSFDHTGYVDMGKLSSVSVDIDLAEQTGLAKNGPVNQTTVGKFQTCQLEFVLEELSIGRFSGGAFGTPIL